MNELPTAWVESSLGDLTTGGLLIDGDWVESKDQDPHGDVRLTQLADVGEGVWRNRSDRRMRMDQAQELGCTFLAPGDVLIARMPEPLGRACIFPGDSRPSVTAVDVCICRPRSETVDPKWLMWFINAPTSRKKIEALQSGTTRKRISRKNLATVTLPVPPRAEQRRIVEAIEELFSRLDAAESSTWAAWQKLVRLRSTVLTKAIRSNHDVVSLGDVIRSLRNGIFVSRPLRCPPGIPIFRISAVRPMTLDTSDVRFAPLGTPDAERYFVDEGDLLFTRYSGNTSYVGSCAVVPRLTSRTLYPDKLIRVVVDRQRILPEFVSLAVNNGPGRRAIEQRLKTTAGQVGIAGGELRTVQIPLPKLEEQQRIVDGISRQLSVYENLVRTIDNTLQRSRRIRRAILILASTGQLALQDPNDEPAPLVTELSNTQPAQLKI